MLFAFTKVFVRGTVDEGLFRIGDDFGWILLLLLSLFSYSTFECSGSVDGEIDSRLSKKKKKKRFHWFP